MGNRNESGRGRIGAVAAVAMLILVTVLGVKLAPVKIAAYELESFMAQQARETTKRNIERSAQAIVSRAAELGFDLRDDDLSISRSSDRVSVTYAYSKVIEFPGYTHEAIFEGIIDEPVFIF